MEMVDEAHTAEAVATFVHEVRRRCAGRLLPRIAAAYQARMTHGTSLVVHTRAARELPVAIAKELSSLAQHVTIEHTIDPFVIGGIQIAYGDVIIDGTVATRVKKLYEA